MATKETVLVTGVSGYLGSHVVDRLVAQGYSVRGTARNSKVAQVQEVYNKTYGSRVHIFGVDDLVAGDYTVALVGVDAVIHLAMPVTSYLDPKSTINVAKVGTMNLIVQAYNAGVKRFSIASSLTTCVADQGTDKTWTHEDWIETTEEEALASGGGFSVYPAAKALAEKAAWEFVKEHPEVSLTTVCPPLFIGPFAPGHLIPPGVVDALSTNAMLHSVLVSGDVLGTPSIGFVDVRDVAEAQVAGIKTPGNHRVLIGSPEWYDLKDVVNYLATTRPELEDRLANPLVVRRSVPVLDNARAVDILGVPITPWRKTVEDGLDSLLKVEKAWEEAGVEPRVIHDNAMRYVLCMYGEELLEERGQA